MEEVKEPVATPSEPVEEPKNNSVTNEDILTYFKQITERLDKLETSKTEPVPVEPTVAQIPKSDDIDFDEYCYSHFDHKNIKKESK